MGLDRFRFVILEHLLPRAGPAKIPQLGQALGKTAKSVKAAADVSGPRILFAVHIHISLPSLCTWPKRLCMVKAIVRASVCRLGTTCKPCNESLNGDLPINQIYLHNILAAGLAGVPERAAEHRRRGGLRPQLYSETQGEAPSCGRGGRRAGC